MTRVPRQRRAAAAVELAIVLPFLAFMFVVAVDFCRVLYYSQAVSTGARNGVLYLADPSGPIQSQYASLQDAVQADASSDYASQLTVTQTSGTDTVGPYTQITVSYPFTSLTNFPGIPKTLTVNRTAYVRPAPVTPN
jgi:Flp pilus assembly protein TadG